jgi:LysR family glycine cleavage system transcriptional activator
MPDFIPYHLPPLNALRAFEAAARHLNFRLAAEEIRVTQGAVAQQVRHLEAVLRVTLFDRLPRGLALTADGLSYFVSVQRALQLISGATDALTHRAATLTLSTTPSFASKWLTPRLVRFADVNPLIDVRIIAEEKLSNFRGDGVDMAIRQGEPPFGAGLAADLLFRADIQAVCSPTLFQGKHRTGTPEDLVGQVLLHDAHGRWPEFLGAMGASHLVDVRKGPRFNQAALAIDAAVEGQGIALTSAPLVERDLAAGRLCRVFDFSLPLPLGYYIVYRQESRDSDSILAMRNWLIAQTSRDMSVTASR